MMADFKQLSIKDTICLGTWSMSGHGFGKYKQIDAIHTLNLGFELGIRHFDTAALYGFGASEKLLGKVFSNRRQEIKIWTKVGFAWQGKSVFHQGNASSIHSQLIQSLKRLNTDYVDVCFLHWPDPNIPIQESIESLISLKKDGYCLEIGIGNLKIEDFQSIQLNTGYFQSPFNPIQHDSSIIELTQKKGFKNWTYSPLCQGLLSKSYRLAKKDIRQKNNHFNLESSIEFSKKWHQDHQNPAHESLKWCLSNKNVDGVIIGPRYTHQINEILNL